MKPFLCEDNMKLFLCEDKDKELKKLSRWNKKHFSSLLESFHLSK